MNKDDSILIVGHNGIVENSLFSYFKGNGYKSVFSSSHDNINIFNEKEVENFFDKQKPSYVFLASSRSGGIAANQKHAADFFHCNILSQNNVIHAAHKTGVKKLLYYGSSCIYPKICQQPMKEDYLLSGPLEPTSESYALAKIVGIKMCQVYRNQYGLKTIVMIPPTVYGPGNDVDKDNAHVLGALLGKFYDAVEKGEKEVVVWGTGNPQREFLFVKDFVDASVFLMDNYDEEYMINVGSGQDISVRDLAELIASVAGFKRKITYDHSKPDGVMQKLLDSGRMAKLGWKAKVNFQEGIKETYEWYKKERSNG